MYDFKKKIVIGIKEIKKSRKASKMKHYIRMKKKNVSFCPCEFLFLKINCTILL